MPTGKVAPDGCDAQAMLRSVVVPALILTAITNTGLGVVVGDRRPAGLDDDARAEGTARLA
jgi:hypothetical protein